MLFPSYPLGSSCDGGTVNVQVGDSTQGSIASTLSAVVPSGGTPIGASLENALTYLEGIDPQKAKHVLLVTDASETCSGDPVQRASDLSSASIPTYVVGFGDGVIEAELNAMAQAGGTALTGPTSYYRADDPAELQLALDDVAHTLCP
jgi:hypothetical protein